MTRITPRLLGSYAVTTLAAIFCVTLTPIGAVEERPGFQNNRPYDQGPTDSIDLFSLNPIVSQPLSPQLRISDTMSLSAVGFYPGFGWSTFFNPSTQQTYSVFYRETGSGLMGAGWAFDIGRIWRWERYNSYSNCTNVDSVYVGPDGGAHTFDPYTENTYDGSKLSDMTPAEASQTYCWRDPPLNRDRRVTTVASWNDNSTFYFDSTTGSLTSRKDTFGNTITYTYMTEDDFLSIEPTATVSQYTFDTNNRYFTISSAPGVPREIVPETIRAPKSMTDSMGRTVTFEYGLISGYSKFLLTEIVVPTPNGTGSYKLYYEMRTIGSAPSGWPAWGGDPVTMPFLIKVELPAADVYHSPLSYNYDYDINTGELVDIRYPSGGRSVFTWGTVYLDETTAKSRGVITKTIYDDLSSSSTAVWQYEKSLYPTHDHGAANGVAIRDRRRTLVRDPVGNETEYRFLTEPRYPSLVSALGATRWYKGLAPRFATGAENLSQLDPATVPYTGKLVRSTTYYYMGNILSGEDWPFISNLNNPLKRVEITTYYDDPLVSNPQDVSTPSTWSAYQLLAEVADPNVPSFHSNWVLPTGFARYMVEGTLDEYVSFLITGPFPDWKETTESGNLVGAPRIIQGRYASVPPAFQGGRIVMQGLYKSQSELATSFQDMAPWSIIQRADTSIPPPVSVGSSMPRTGDIVTTYTMANPTSGSTAKGDISQITYAGGSGGNASVPTYTETLVHKYGSLAGLKHGSYAWSDPNSDIDQTGVETVTRDSAGIPVQRTYDNLGRLTGVIPVAPELPTYSTYNSGSQTYYDNSGAQRTHRYASSVSVTKGTSGQHDYEETLSFYDGFGRVKLTQRLTATGTWVKQTRAYDALGSPSFVSEWHLPDDFNGATPPPGTSVYYADSSDPNDTARDPFGRTRKVVTADGSVSTVRYFGLNSEVTVKGINGVSTATSITKYYRDYQNRVRIVDGPAEGADAIYSYDHLGHLTEIRLVSQVSFASASTLQTDRFVVTNTGGQVRSFEYNALGLLERTTHPEKGDTLYQVYDAKGNVLRKQDSTPADFRYTYDAAGRLVLSEAKASNDPDTAFQKLSETTYRNTVVSSDPHGVGALGQPIEIRAYNENDPDVTAVRSLIYNGLNGRQSKDMNVFAFWQNDANDPNIETTFAYNNSGLISELVYPKVTGTGPGSARKPTRLTYAYTHGYLQALDSNRQGSDPNIMAALVTGVGYNYAGGVSSVTYASGVTESIAPDIQFRPSRIRFTKASTTLWDSLPYQYDGAGNIIAIGGQTYTYDNIGRLATASTVSPVNSATLYEQSYGYDLYGNMTLRNDYSESAGGLGNQVFDVDATTNRLEHLNPASTNLTYFYYPNGTVRKDGIRAYGWDRAGRMRTLMTLDESTILAAYDYDDRDYRIQTSTNTAARRTVYVRDESGQVLTEFAKPTSSFEAHWKKDYIYALGRHIALVENTEPDTPTGITSNSSAGNVSLNWLQVTTPDLYGYDVYRAPVTDPNNYTKLTGGTPTTSLSYQDSSGTSLTAYYYKLVSVDQANIESTPTSPRKIKVNDATAPIVPGTFAAEAAGTTTAQVTWSATTDYNLDSDIAGYNVYRKTTAASTWPSTPRNTTSLITGTSFSDTGLLGPCGSYDYRMEAVDTAGNKSAYTESVTIITPPLDECGGGGQASIQEPEDSLDADRSSPYRVIGLGPEEVNYRIRYLHVDHLGTPRVITDNAGAVVAKAAFFPFGDPVPGSTSAGNTHWFTGHERDFLANQDYMLARSFSLVAGRFASADQVIPLSPGHGGLHAYSLGNPIRFTDPTGQDALDCIAFAFSSAGAATLGIIGVAAAVAPEPLFTKAGAVALWTTTGSLAWTARESGKACFQEERAKQRLAEKREKGKKDIDNCIANKTLSACIDAKAACREANSDDPRCDLVDSIVNDLSCQSKPEQCPPKPVSSSSQVFRPLL